MRKIKILTSFLLLAAFTNTVLANDECPPPEEVRNSGSKFTYAYAVDEGKWQLISQAFNWKNENWQTLYTFNIFTGDPASAITFGQSDFEKSPLTKAPKFTKNGNQMKCNYTPPGASYTVEVITPAGYGYKIK